MAIKANIDTKRLVKKTRALSSAYYEASAKVDPEYCPEIQE